MYCYMIFDVNKCPLLVDLVFFSPIDMFSCQLTMFLWQGVIVRERENMYVYCPPESMNSLNLDLQHDLR